MARSSPDSTNTVLWQLAAAVGSVAIVSHLAAVALGALAAPSGPWGSPQGFGPAPPPQFAYSGKELANWYLWSLNMTHNYHFATNRPMAPGVYLEARLMDEEGNVRATVKLPDDQANPWVRHRQKLLAQWLGEDQSIDPPRTEVVPAPFQDAPTVRLWRMDRDQLTIQTVDVNELLRNRQNLPPMLMGPSELSLLAARSYGRHLCRTHGAAKVEIIRHHQDPIPPSVLFEDSPEKALYDKQKSNFGEFPR